MYLVSDLGDKVGVRYALKLDSDNRILSVTFEQFAEEGAIIVDSLPEGDVHDYKYVNGEYVHGEYVHDPIPKELEVEHGSETERRLSACENNIEQILTGLETMLNE